MQSQLSKTYITLLDLTKTQVLSYCFTSIVQTRPANGLEGIPPTNSKKMQNTHLKQHKKTMCETKPGHDWMLICFCWFCLHCVSNIYVLGTCFFYLDLCRPGLNNCNTTIAQHLRFCQVSRPQINIVILIMVCINNKTLKQHIVQNLGFGDFW